MNVLERTISLIFVAFGLTILRFSLWTLRNSAASVDSVRLFIDSCFKRHTVICMFKILMYFYLNEIYYYCRYLFFHKYVLFNSPLFVLVGSLSITALNQINRNVRAIKLMLRSSFISQWHN